MRQHRGIRYWWNAYWPILLFGGLLFGSLGGLIFGVMHDNAKEAEHKRAFMGQCLEDHKQYECDALWGQAREDKGGTTVFIPMSR